MSFLPKNFDVHSWEEYKLKLHLKIAELKINYNNLYSNLNTEFNVRNSNNIVLTTISNSERYIPT